MHMRIATGISYLNITEETKYKDALHEYQKTRANNAASPSCGNRIPVPQEDAAFIDGVM